MFAKDDQDYLIKQAHVGHIIKPEWKNPTRGVQTKDVIKNYFTQLSKTQIIELYEMFRYVHKNSIKFTYIYMTRNIKICRVILNVSPINSKFLNIDFISSFI